MVFVVESLFPQSSTGIELLFFVHKSRMFMIMKETKDFAVTHTLPNIINWFQKLT